MSTLDSSSGSVHPPDLLKIFIVDDHPVMRRGYKALFTIEGDIYVCGEAGTWQDALERIPRTNPDLVIVDLSMNGKSSIEHIEQLHTVRPGLPILVSSGYEKELYEKKVREAGAVGYIEKSEFLNVGVPAIRSLLPRTPGTVC